MLRPVADVGRDYQPGAWGIRDGLTIEGGAARTVGGREVYVVRSKENDRDGNLARLELCSNEVDRDTVCALGSAGAATKCRSVDVETTYGCGPGAVVPDLDAQTKAVLDERKKDWGTKTTELVWSIDRGGGLVVKDARTQKTRWTAALFGPNP